MDVVLLPLQKEDIELVRTWRNSPDVAKYMYTDQLITKEQQEKWYEQISEDQSKKYWIITYDNKKIGLVSLTGIDRNLNSCYWAFYLGDTSIRGAGIGSKVEYTILQYVFEELNLNKLRCEVFTSNVKVISMHEKFGFRREAYYRQHALKNGTYLDVVGLAMLKQDWKNIQEKMRAKIYDRK